jgi:S1-C subfamily serine protease
MVSSRRMRRLLIVLVALIVAPVTVGILVAARSFTRDQSGPAVASGIGVVQGTDCSGQPLPPGGFSMPDGTGFLIGSHTMMTASHVVYAWLTDRGACRIRVRLDGAWHLASRIVLWTDKGTRHWLDTDLATFSIQPHSDGHVFRISASPPVGSRVTAVGFPLGEPLDTLAGTVSRRAVVRHIPLVVVKPRRAKGGHSGSPILDEHGDVVGVESLVTPRDMPGDREDIAGIDLRAWWGEALIVDLCTIYEADSELGCGSGDDAMARTKLATPIRSLIPR